MGAITARSNNRRRAAGGLLAVPIAAIVLLCVLALAFVTYVLRPRVEAAPATLEAPALPIVVADTLFRVPPRALCRGNKRSSGRGLAKPRRNITFAIGFRTLFFFYLPAT